MLARFSGFAGHAGEDGNSVIHVYVRNGADDGMIKRILDVAERVRREFAVSVRVDVEHTLVYDPVAGWTHRIGEPACPDEYSYTILRDGSQIEVIVNPDLEESELEEALVRAAMMIMGAGVVPQVEWPSAGSRRDPGSFTAGEHLAVSAAM